MKVMQNGIMMLYRIIPLQLACYRRRVNAQLKGGFAGIPMHFYGVLNYRRFYLIDN